MSEKKALFYLDSFLGFLGEPTGSYALYNQYGRNERVELKVGDVVSFVEYGRSHTLVVCKNCFEKAYGVYGFGSNKLDFKHLTRILTHEDLTEDLFQKLQKPTGRNRDFYTIRDIDIREMTVSEIERELGYKVKIKSE
ncbi:hypothetical protein J26TS2_00210 [Shouchella clausii]|nr:hypothetical protein J26TS2_00210 [Shouchella clausii]